VPKVSQDHLDARRQQILAGAQRCFAQHGYTGATVARLEQEIGLSRGAIFNYFPSKQELFLALAIEVNRRYGRLLLEGGVEAAIRAMAAEDPEWLGVVFEVHGKLRHDPDFVRRLDEASDAARPTLQDWFEAKQANGTFRDDVSGRDLGRFVTMVLNGLALRVVGEEETDVDATLKLLHDAVAPRQ
jgi:AcrR family transcriptional regulator